jgi:hypothetical protein
MNSLTGSIPSDLGQIAGMRELYLQNNTLNGSIPGSLGDMVNLTNFNVSYNLLSGSIPVANALGRFGNTSYLGNPGLCGPPLSTPCKLTPSPSPPSVHTTRRLLSVSALIAIAAAGVIALGVILITLLSIWAMKKQTQQPKTEILVYESTPPTPDVSPIVGKLVLFNKVLPTRFEDWETGTKALLNKECVIGRGSIGVVYRATFDDGLSIAIKKLETLGRIKNSEEFESEMNSLGDMRHTNLVTLQGYYWSSSMQLMLSDYIANSTLAAHLHQQQSSQTSLVWSRRFRIATGVARGLAYLHHDLRLVIHPWSSLYCSTTSSPSSSSVHFQVLCVKLGGFSPPSIVVLVTTFASQPQSILWSSVCSIASSSSSSVHSQWLLCQNRWVAIESTVELCMFHYIAVFSTLVHFQLLCVRCVGCFDCGTGHKFYISALVKFLELCMFHYIMFFFVGALPSFVRQTGGLPLS